MPAPIPNPSVPDQVPNTSPEALNQMPNGVAPTPPASAPQVKPFTPAGDGIIDNPAATSLSNFINDAHSAGYGSIDPNIITAIGHSMGNNNNSKLALAQVKQSLAIPNKTSQYLYEPSAMSPVQSLGKVLQDHVQNTGIQTINAEPTKALQQSLINEGFAPTGAIADGVWNADWNNASYAAGTARMTHPGFGTFSARNAFQTIFGQGWENHAIALVESFARAIPAGIIQGVGAVEKGIAHDQALHTLMTSSPIAPTSQANYQNAQTDALGIAHAIDAIGRITDGQKKIGTQAYLDSPFGHQDLLSVLNAALSLSGVGTLTKLGAATVTGIKEGIAAGTEAGASNAGKALFTDIGKQQPQGIMNTIMNSVFPKTATGNRIAFTRWLHNVPAAQGLVNGLDEFATNLSTAAKVKGAAAAASDSIGGSIIRGYKTIRSAAATPYRLPIVGIGGKLLSDTSIAGMKIGIQGHTENWLHDPSAPQAYALDHLKPIAGLAGQTLDVLQLGAHGPSYDSAGLPSQQIAKVAQNIHENFADAANSTGVVSGYERGVNGSVLKEQNDLAKAGLNPDLRLKQISSKYMDKAALHAAQSVVENNIADKVIDPINADQRLRFLQNYQTVIRNDPAKLFDAIRSYYAKPMQWETDLQKEMSLSKGDPASAFNHGNVNYTKAQELFKTHLLPRLADLKTPDSIVADNFAKKLAKDTAPPAFAADSLSTLPTPDPQILESAKTDYQTKLDASNAAETKFQETKNKLAKPLVSQSDLNRAKNALTKARQKLQESAEADKPKALKDFQTRQNILDSLKKEFNEQVPTKKSDLNRAKVAWTSARQDLNQSAKALDQAQKRTPSTAVVPPFKKVEPWDYKSLNDAQLASLNDQPISSKFGISRVESLHAPDLQKQALAYAGELAKVKQGYVAPTSLKGLLEPSSGDNFGFHDAPSAIPQTYNPATATAGEQTLRAQVRKQLGQELGRNVDGLAYVPTQDLIKLMAEKSHWLAGDVGVPDDLKWVEAEMAKLGYKPNYGTDVGNQWTDSLLPKEMLGSPRNLAHKGIDKLGLNLAQVEPKYLVQAKTTAVQTEVQNTINKIKLENNTLPDWITGDRLMMKARDIIKPSYNGLSKAYMDLVNVPVIGKAVTLRPALGKAWGDEIKALIGTTQTDVEGNSYLIDNPAKAKDFILHQIAASNSPQTWLKKDWMKAMTDKGLMDRVKSKNGAVTGRTPQIGETGIITNNKGFEADAIGMSTKEANQLWSAMHRGFAKTPHYIAGINPFSKLMNSTFGLANIPLEINGNRILDLTGHVQPTLIQARYSVAPLQSWLRVAKSAAKGVNEGMPPTANAHAALAELGPQVEKAAYDLTNKAFGVNKEAEDVASEFSNAEVSGYQDLSNVYNPRATLARTVHYVAENMKSEGKVVDSPAGLDELRSRTNAVNNYGNRTAAEQTVNAFFFPFSFEKTVVRELGGALLDSPSLRMMAAGAIAAYNSADGQKTKTWMEQNLPAFKILERANPFYYGVGGGSFGGINKTPYSVAENLLFGNKPTPKNPLDGVSAEDKLDLFVKMLLPKPITTKASAIAALATIPALKELATNVFGYNPSSSAPGGLGSGAIATTAKTLWWEAGSELSKVVHGQFTGNAVTDNWASQGHLPYQVQQNDAWQLRSQMIAKYAGTLAANQHGGNNGFPIGFPAGFVGQKMTLTNIGLLLHEIYPAFDPAKTFATIGIKATAVSEIRSEIATKSPTLLPWYNQFVKYSDQVQGFISKDSLLPTWDSSKLVAPMQYLRNLAATLSANDPSFPAFYAKYYATKYGPLKGL